MTEEIFELLTKMYAEMNERLGSMDEKFDSMEKRFDRLEEKADTSSGNIMNLESELKHAKNILLDGYKQTYEWLTALEEKFDELSEKVEEQGVRLEIIENGKEKEN